MGVESLLRIHGPGQGIVIGLRDELKICASLGNLIDLSLPAAGNRGHQAGAHDRYPAAHQLPGITLGRIFYRAYLRHEVCLRALHGRDGVLHDFLLIWDKTQPLKQSQQQTKRKTDGSTRLALVLERPDREALLLCPLRQFSTSTDRHDTASCLEGSIESVQCLLRVAGVRGADHKRF
jgi:hypothetical protein